ncbi:hypothetical protein [Xanthomonas sp. MUS 060]|uniref:hypothetical protein n=1 Tax=Xanthomonas sp. MUS 060 TaxID=1588031 RepID=UPI0009E193AA|nr:hypothetical protein [Xanthomonas sp. MUS 060]
MSATSGKTGAAQVNADGNPVYRKNPHPTKAYRIRMTIDDAPGPFGYISGVAGYQMTNHDGCTPVDNHLLGMSTKPKEDDIPLQFKKLDESTYIAILYADGMIDADYYGMGVCRFELTGVGMTLRATGKREETRFQPWLIKSDIDKGDPRVIYFWKGRYPKGKMEDFLDSGRVNASDFNETARHEIFKVTLTTEKVSP